MDLAVAAVVTWTQKYMPFGDSYLVPALVAAIPLIILFVMLAVMRKPGHKAAFVATTVAGVGFAWRRIRSGSLVAPIMAHVATNSVSLVAAWMVVH